MKIRLGMKAWVVLASLACVSVGCEPSSDKGTGSVTPGTTTNLPQATQLSQSLAALTAVQGCDDVLSQLKAKTIEDMEKQLEEARQQALDALTQEWGCYDYGMEGDAMGGAAGGQAPPSAATNDAPGAEPQDSKGEAHDYSTTNTQVAGVDEADFIKNDGSYIYVAADGKLQIIAAWPAEEAHLLSEVDVEGTPSKLFIYNDKALVYSSLGYLGQNADYYGGGSYPISQCTYGYDCDFTGDGQILKITVFDIKDRKKPVLLRETVFNGSYLNSRRIGDTVYSVVIFPEVSVPGISYTPEGIGYYWDWCYNEDQKPTEAQINEAYDALLAKNKELIEASSITEYLPGVKDTRYAAGQAPLVEEGLLNGCKGFYTSNSADGKSFLSVLSFKMDDLGAISATTIVGRPGAVYASESSLYVAVRHYAYDMVGSWYYESQEETPEATTLHKFSLGGAQGTAYLASGFVKGHVLNQFSMDDSDGYLRIATSTGHVPDPSVHSTVSVLAESNGALEVVGMVDNIAPTEDIRSVRFNGDVGFMVTFKKTDPLFVLDLANPKAPAIKGELKIPGFSTYMHVLDDNHVLSIGYDADDQGSFAWFQGIQLQIFDVTDLSDPKLMHKEVIGTRGSTSDAATDHLAFNYFPSRKLLAIPMTICEGGDGGQYGDKMSFSGLLVYRVTTASGFEKLGGVPHQEPETDQNYWGACGSWWTQSNSLVKRSIFMDDWVFSVALDLIQVSSLEDLEHPVQSIQIAEPAQQNQPEWD